MILKGGLFSDNRISIDLDKADAMVVDGARLMGFSDLYKKVASESEAPTHCSKYTAQKECESIFPQPPPHPPHLLEFDYSKMHLVLYHTVVGIQSHLWMVDPNQPFGAKIQGVSFSDFANQGCKGFMMNWSNDSRGYFGKCLVCYCCFPTMVFNSLL